MAPDSTPLSRSAKAISASAVALTTNEPQAGRGQARYAVSFREGGSDRGKRLEKGASAIETDKDRTTRSADVQGPLWSTRGKDWADVQEQIHRPMYEAVLSKVPMGHGTRLLDIGCGSGTFCAMAAERGGVVTGIDAASGLIAIAKQRTPQGDFRVGEMEMLPYDNGGFDIVTGFYSFQFAARLVRRSGQFKLPRKRPYAKRLRARSRRFNVPRAAIG